MEEGMDEWEVEYNELVLLVKGLTSVLVSLRTLLPAVVNGAGVLGVPAAASLPHLHGGVVGRVAVFNFPI
jgi:hypothetical protein